MKIGMLAFVASYTIDPANLARKLEAAGFESIWLPEHPVIPVEHKTPFPRGDGKIPKAYYHMIDPFVGLALAAAASKTIKLGTGICLVPERDPIVTAKEVATLDHYSGGRFLFGIEKPAQRFFTLFVLGKVFFARQRHGGERSEQLKAS